MSLEHLFELTLRYAERLRAEGVTRFLIADVMELELAAPALEGGETESESEEGSKDEAGYTYQSPLMKRRKRIDDE
jgi:hypothetical protein